MRTKTSTIIISVIASMLFLFIRPTTLGAQAPLEGPGSGLMGWWKFDEGSGTTVYDSSGNGNTGVFIGNPTWTTGISGGGLRFNGYVDFVRIPVNSSLNTGIMTIAVWVNVADFLKSSPSFYGWGRNGCYDNYRGWMNPNGFVQASYQNIANQTIRTPIVGNAGTVKLGEWAHYVFTYSGDAASVTIALYKNGVLAKTPYTASDGLDNCGQMTAIGAQEDLSNPAYVRVFSGVMDDFRVYNRVLSTDEITTLYNELKPTYTDTTAPTTPTGLTATAINSARVDLSWTASSDAAGVVGYIIYRGGSAIDTVRGATTYSDTAHGVSSTFAYTVAPTTTYSYTVAAYDAAYNVSSQSSAASATTPAYSDTGPYSLTITRVGTGLATVSSTPSGISCGSICTYGFPSGTVVVLTPYPYIQGMFLPLPAFSGWAGGGCIGIGECFIVMDSNKAVTANYGTSPPDTTPPTVTAFSIPGTSSSLTVSITGFTASDNIGVTGYMLTESSTAPLAGNPGWTVTAPTSFTFTSYGSKTLYAWAKDAAGNVSASLSASVTISSSNDPYDLNNDGIVDLLDLQILTNVALGVEPCAGICDLNGDGKVDVLDLQALINRILGF